MSVNREFDKEKNLIKTKQNRQVFKECTGLRRARDEAKKDKRTRGERQMCQFSEPLMSKIRTARTARLPGP